MLIVPFFVNVSLLLHFFRFCKVSRPWNMTIRECSVRVQAMVLCVCTEIASAWRSYVKKKIKKCREKASHSVSCFPQALMFWVVDNFLMKKHRTKAKMEEREEDLRGNSKVRYRRALSHDDSESEVSLKPHLYWCWISTQQASALHGFSGPTTILYKEYPALYCIEKQQLKVSGFCYCSELFKLFYRVTDKKRCFGQSPLWFPLGGLKPPTFRLTAERVNPLCHRNCQEMDAVLYLS